MVINRNVIVLKAGVSFRERLSEELTQNNFVVRGCTSVSEFAQLYAHRPVPVVIIVGVPHMLSVYATRVREKAALSAVVALGFGVNSGWRLRIMAAGADACHAIYTDIRELTAIFAAWGRHAGFAMDRNTRAITGAPPALWRLSANGRVLASPYGRTLALTSLESGFLRRIAISDGHLLRRHDKSLANDGLGATLESRNVDVLVSRLRRKARYVGIDLPLRAVRGCGYVFAEGLDMSIPEGRS